MDPSLELISRPHIGIYESLYNELNGHGKDAIAAHDAAAFLKRSNLGLNTLGQIWELADAEKKGFLDKRGAFIAFKLVAACQQGHRPVMESLAFALGPPAFASRSATPSVPNFGNTPPTSSWAITPSEQAKFESIFVGLNPVNDKIPGDKVRPVLLNSGLPGTSLAKIWELADMDKDGQLDRIEMCVALHLVYCALQGEPIPNRLPLSLIHPSKRNLPQYAGGLPGPMKSQSIGSRSRAGSITSLDSFNMRYVSPDRVRSQSVQPVPTLPTPTSTPSTLPYAAGWPVQTNFYEPHFRRADSNQDGFVSGIDVHDLLLTTGTPQAVLAALWSLVDLKRNGLLNLEQFALIMYLIDEYKQKKRIPDVLPPNLIPPSLKPREAAELDTTLIGNPELSALEKEVEKLILDRRQADQEIVQLEADMTVKNSEIKNLKIELTTLESTVQQLEKQKFEAEKRLASLDVQITQLEKAVEQSKEKLAEEEKRLSDLRCQNVDSDAEKTERDELMRLSSDVRLLEEEKRSLATTLAQREAIIENASLQLTELENKFSSIDEKTRRVDEENQKLKQLTERLTDLITKNDIETLEEERNTFLAEFPVISPLSESSGMASANQHSTDPFAFCAKKGIDPFVGSEVNPSSFTSQGNDPFAATTQADAENTSKTAPPPRPAPPKCRAAPVDDPFSVTDPFAASPATYSGSQFADFANFDALAQS